MRFQPLVWGENVRGQISPAFSHYPGELEAMQAEIKAGQVAAYQLDQQGVILIKLLQHARHREFFLVAAAGWGMVPALRAIEAKAYWAGFHVVKFHTRRKGITRMAKVAGYQVIWNGTEWECEKWVRAVQGQMPVKKARPIPR